MRKLLLAAAFPMVAAMLGGCYVAPEDRDAYVSPPPPRYVVVEQRPGYLWIDGHWYWGSGNWLWSDGYYVVDRPGYVWTPGYYHGRVYYPGRWGGHGGGNYYAPQPSQATRAIERARTGSQAQGYTPGGSRAGQAPPTYSAPASVAPSRASQAIPRPAPTSAPAPAPAPSSGHTRDHRK
jgi:YXWGXW repeat-containing protein